MKNIINNYIIPFLILFFTLTSVGQLRVSFAYEKIEIGYKMVVSNDEFCPISIKIDFDLTNLSSTKGKNMIFVVPAKTENFNFTNLAISGKGKYGFSYTTSSNYGNHYLTDYDKDYNYSLPFKKGSSYTVHQGYNGAFSHQNEYSLDFTMPVGTEVLAVRGGTVIKVIQINSIVCAEKRCAQYNNYILIYHADGTFSKYVHIKKNGAIVKEGDIVKENDLIAYSGNVGWSNGPHLHFVAFIQRISQQETLPTNFKINDGTTAALLEEKTTYYKDY